MSADMIKAIADLAWPVLAALLLAGLLPTIRKVIQSRAVTIKYGEMAVSVQDSSDQLSRQVQDLQTQFQNLQATGAHALTQTPLNKTAPTSNRTILWVDDKPQRKAHEIAKLQSDGWDIISAKSTDEALKILRGRAIPPTLIIAEMTCSEGFTSNKTAGLDLVREVRALKLTMPIYIYTSTTDASKNLSVTDLGGNAITASPLELFQLVTSNLEPQEVATIRGRGQAAPI